MFLLTIVEQLQVSVDVLLDYIKINSSRVFDELLGLVNAVEFVFGTFDDLLDCLGDALSINF